MLHRGRFGRGSMAAVAGAALLFTTANAHAGQVTITLFENGVQQGGSMTFNAAQGSYAFVFPGTLDYSGIAGTLTTNDNTGTSLAATMSLMYQAARTVSNPGVSEQIQVVATDSFFTGFPFSYNASSTLSGSVFNTGLAPTGATSAVLNSTFTGSTSTTIPLAAPGVNVAVFAQGFGPVSGKSNFNGASNLTLTADLRGSSATANDVLALQGDLQATTTPEPASLALVGSAAICLGAAGAWRTRRKAAAKVN